MSPIHPPGDLLSIQLNQPSLIPPHPSPSPPPTAPHSTFKDVLYLFLFQFSIVFLMLIVIASVVAGLLTTLSMARRSSFGQGLEDDDGGRAEALARARFGRVDDDGFGLGLGLGLGMGMGMGMGMGVGQGLEGGEVWVQGPPPYVEGQEPPAYEGPPEYEE